MDTIILHARIVDGSGSPAFRGDIGLQDDRIAAIGDLSAASGATLIDGTGLVAAPGFIDIHSHSDFSLPINPGATSKVRQGVTTEVIGQCGLSPAPLDATTRENMRAQEPNLPWTWVTFSDYVGHLVQQGTSVNVVPLVGHGTIRSVCMAGARRPPTIDELKSMKNQVAQALDEGAWGMSTGLIYPPSSYSTTDELVDLATVVARKGGFYFSHIRNEKAQVLQAAAEAIEIGDRAGLPVQIAHLKVASPEHWTLLPRLLALIDLARARGTDVAADRYPYLASSNGLADQLPGWVHEGGLAALLKRVQEPETRARLIAELETMPVHWDKIVIVHSPLCAQFEGQSVAEAAAQLGTSPQAAALNILRQAEGRVSIINFCLSEDNLRTVLSHPAVMIGSDAEARTPEGPLGEGREHPRSYGTFPRVLGKYVREERILSLPEAVHKMTGLPADRLRLSDRGRLVPGYKADLVLFDANTIRDRATYTDPYQFPVGIEYVYVNGQAVVTPTGHTGALPGQILPRPSA